MYKIRFFEDGEKRFGIRVGPSGLGDASRQDQPPPPHHQLCSEHHPLLLQGANLSIYKIYQWFNQN